MSLDSAAEGGDDVSNLRPSAAPSREKRSSFMKRIPSQSVKNLLDTVEPPDTR